MRCFSRTGNPAALILTTLLVFSSAAPATPRVSCELTLYSHAKMLISAKALHRSLLARAFAVTYLTSDPMLLQPLALRELLDADTGALHVTFKEQGEDYVLTFHPTDMKIRFRLPPVVAWENFDLSKAELERVMIALPDASADLDHAFAYGTILDPRHRFRPYLQVHGLVKSKTFGWRITLGLYASCRSALAANYRNSQIEVLTPSGWRCFIPVLEGQAYPL